MGQKHATLAVMVDQSEIVPGEPITGRVYLDVLKSEKTNSTSLILTLSGIETTEVRWTQSANVNGKPQTTSHSTSQTHEIVKHAYTLASSDDGYFVAGRQEYPFQVTIPVGSPPSISAAIHGTSGGECSVTYSIEAKLTQPGWFKWDIKTNASLIVKPHPSPSVSQAPIYVTPSRHDITYFCCCLYYGQGSITLGLQTAGLLCHNSPFDIAYVIQQQSSAEITGLEITIVEDLTWFANSKHRSIRTKLYESVTMPQLADPSQTADDLRQALEARRYKVSGEFSSAAKGTMKSALVEVKHTLIMTVKTSFGSTNPTVSAPLYVHPYRATSLLPPAVVTAQPVAYGNEVMNVLAVQASAPSNGGELKSVVGAIEPSAPPVDVKKV
eukprot:gene14394-15931_t